MPERFLVAGALGCIGAWTVKRLIQEGAQVWMYDLPGEPHRLRLIMNDAALSRVNFVHGDITDAESFDRAVSENAITHIIHLAALQVPFVRANPVLGARVNVVGTTTPTKGMLAAAVGRPYHISYGGTIVFQYADDTARAFIQAVRANMSGAEVYNLGGTEASMESIVRFITAAAPEADGKITFNPEALQLASHVDGAPLEAAIGKLSWTPVEEGVNETIAIFRSAARAGKVSADKILA
jgi:nucleoside-diphosphate-sugar epimerase